MKWHDKFSRKKKFKPCDWSLLFDSRLKKFKGKLSTHWLGPYEIERHFDNGSVKIKTIDKEGISFLVNGHILRLYQKPSNREEFFHNLLQRSEMEIVSKGNPSPSPISN
jgi:hypothetical protein